MLRVPLLGFVWRELRKLTILWCPLFLGRIPMCCSQNSLYAGMVMAPVTCPNLMYSRQKMICSHKPTQQYDIVLQETAPPPQFIGNLIIVFVHSRLKGSLRGGGVGHATLGAPQKLRVLIIYIYMRMDMGQNPVSPVNIPIPTNFTKTGGAPIPKW